MGCHTWFKVESKYSLEELRQIWIQQRINWIERWETFTKNPECEERTEGGIFSSYTQEYFDWYLKVYKRQFDFVKKGIVKQDFIHHLTHMDDEDMHEIHNGILYCDNEDVPHDIFRIGDYPDDILFSFEESKKFIEKNRDKIFYGTASSQAQSEEECLYLLRNFWNKNRIGMIDFG